MRKTGLINKISSQNMVSSIKDMQVLDEHSKPYFNFINSLKSESTRKSYTYCIEKFLGHYEKDMDQFLRLSQEEMTNLITKYFVDKKISNQYKNLISATLKHACEINYIILNWRKIKKFINSDKTGNEGKEYSIDKIPVSLYTLKSVGIDPGFSSSGTGIVVLEHLRDSNIIRIIESHLIEKGDPNKIVELCWSIWKKHNWQNTLFFIDGSNRAMVNLLKIRWEEPLTWETSESFGPNTRIRPVNFSTGAS